METTMISLSGQKRIAGHYVLKDKIGKGGMGDVYLGLDERLDRQVAIKQLKIESESPELRDSCIQRFRQEAKAIARLNHPHIVALYDIATEDHDFYLIMEYVQGCNLQELMHRQQQVLPLGLAVQMGIQLAEALKQAHVHNIIHRDIKPANLLLTPDNDLKLTDFGIAQLNQSQDLRITQAGAMLGSFLYASPEQLVNAADIDQRTDIYAFGATLYELLTGQTVYAADNVGQLIQKVFMESPKALRDFNPELPEALEQLILRCLDKHPEMRFQHMSEILNQLYALRGDKPLETATLPAPAPLCAPDTRNSAMPLKLLKNTPQRTGQALQQGLQTQTDWLTLCLAELESVQNQLSFAQVKKQIQQADLQGKTFSGVLVFADVFVFVRNGLICGALHRHEARVDDAALARLAEQAMMQHAYSLPAEQVLTLACLASGSGTAVQEHLDSRVVNLFSIVEDLEAEVEAFTGYVICQQMAPEQEAQSTAQYVFIYHQGRVLWRFGMHSKQAEQGWQHYTGKLSTLLEHPFCLLSIYMPAHQMLDTVLHDFLRLAHLKLSYREADDTTLESLALLREQEISEWMRNSLYEGLRQNICFEMLSENETPFPEMLSEALTQRGEYSCAEWIMTDFFIALHAHGQWQAFARLYQALPEIKFWRFFETLPLHSGHLQATLSAYGDSDEQPLLLVQSGRGDLESVSAFFEQIQTLNRHYLDQGSTGLTAAFYFASAGFDAQSLVWYGKYIEKISLFQKQKGFVKSRGKQGFYALLVDQHLQPARLIAPTLI